MINQADRSADRVKPDCTYAADEFAGKYVEAPETQYELC